jgi:coproporphyrinogen III oxidase-like Fe-S oxidoreductase
VAGRLDAGELARLAERSPYQAYVYAYPHKTAYRRLDPAPQLRDVWVGERRHSLFLYLHVPFCEMRCGFCNLFTRSRPGQGLPDAYLTALGRQATVAREALGAGTGFARSAIGGGTPTYLDPGDLARLLDIAEGVMGADLGAIPLSVETSPATATPERLALLRARGTTRISIGVQSFLEAETRALGRPQQRAEVEQALGRIRACGVDVLNIDLMYGIAGQTKATWTASLDAALAWRPEELYLYPLYVRELTGLGRRGRILHNDQRLALYRAGRAHLLAAGYEQVSMRMFRRAGTPNAAGPAYCCQEDGMVGLGSGARSYTTGLHYSFDYAVSSAAVSAILADYVRRPADGFRTAQIGFRLDADEQRRRWLLKSLLHGEGVEPDAYRQRFGTEVTADFPQLAQLAELGWTELGRDGAPLRLTPAGLASSDAIGPWLFSERVRAAMAGFGLR